VDRIGGVRFLIFFKAGLVMCAKHSEFDNFMSWY